MPGKPNKPDQKPGQSPADVAREAFRRLAVRRVAPTPDAYREVYDEITGKPQQAGPEKVLSEFALNLAGISDAAAAISADIERSVASRDWNTCTDKMTVLIERYIRSVEKHGVVISDTSVAEKPSSPALPVGNAKAAAANPPQSPAQRMPLVDAPIPSARGPSIPLVDDMPATGLPAPKPRSATDPASPASPADSQQDALLRDMLSRALTLGVASLLRAAPALAEEAERLAASVKAREAGLDEISAQLKQLCFKIEMKCEDMAEEHELLLRLFRLLLENVSELLEDDSWVSGQIAGVRDLLSGPISRSSLVDATRNLKEVIYKQGMLKHSLTEAKVTVKNMMMTFIDRLGAVATSTGDFHKKIDQYSHKISNAQDIAELNDVLDDVMRDTRIAQTEALRSRDEMVHARQEVQEAEGRIHELEAKLEQMSELVREDELTGSLNRRGLDDVFEREFARAERRKSPLCIALLDLDDFKRLNDTYGHSAGDEALVHLVRVVKETLRTMDVIARFGGEEFLIVLPETKIEDAIQTITRVQRELTKRLFMHDNAKLLITFSAGVALRAPAEDQAAMIKRADQALYAAKNAGKNRVVAAG